MNNIYERIVELDGDCFKYNAVVPKCEDCSFLNKCLGLTLTVGKHIPSETRLGWALDKLAEEILLDVES